MSRWSFDAQVTAADFDAGGAVFALGDGSVRFASGERQDAHDGAVLSAAVHPSGDGLVTGGDDGRIVWSRRDGTEVLAEVPGRWIDSVATAPETGLIAAAAGRSLVVLDAADRAFRRDHAAERTLAAVAVDPKGRRVAAATYGGALVWFARSADQRPTLSKWGGSH
ncbi:MAG: H-X9-DG-CTERM domain-containing protein, partial [Brevundimonas sp.]